jgi:DNA-binding CsgD family transcriptional regulator
MNHTPLRPLNFSPSVLLAHTSRLVREGITGILQQAGYVVLDQRNDQEELFNSLSEREREVLPLITDGLTNREIASILIITENTVKVHLRNILYKLDLRNCRQLAAVAAQGGYFRNPALPDLATNG